MRTVYVIGVPGVGKSTAVEAALRRLGAAGYRPEDKPVPHLRYVAADGKPMGVWEVGRRRRGSFSGTDALGMAINPVACEWVAGLDGTAPDVLVGEGDRLANDRFLRTCGEAGALTVVLLDAPLDVARARAAERAARLGTAVQSDAWWKGRATKVSNLAASRPVERIDATAAPTAVAAALAEIILPKT